MYGLAVNLIMSVSGHPSIINEILAYEIGQNNIFSNQMKQLKENKCPVLKSGARQFYGINADNAADGN